MSTSNREALLLDLHEQIYQQSDKVATFVYQNALRERITYPPGGQFSEEEQTCLNQLAGDKVIKSVVAKLLASNAASLFFHFFNLIDGTGDPSTNMEEWTGVRLVDKAPSKENYEFLHDAFFETYHRWVDQKERG